MYTTAILLSANLAAAETISDKELQDRFNKAFSIFNNDANRMDFSKNTPTSEDVRDEDIVSNESEEKSNIVKSTNSVVITSEERGLKTETLTLPSINKKRPTNPANFILLQERPVVVDMLNVTLKQIVQEALNQVTYGEKWTIKWRLKDENKYILKERINLTAEVTFDQFVSNMLETITNITGIRLSTKVFNQNRIIIITDTY